MDDLDINETEKTYLIAKINQVKEMFQEELDHPEMIINKNKRASAEELFKKQKTMIEEAAAAKHKP